MSDLAITPAEFEKAIAPYVQADEKLAIAVSGGPDSMALTFCLRRYADPQNLLALIVEHGLREESAREAASVAEKLRAMDIETEILPWTHEDMKSRIHVRAREARYGLLIDACKKHGITTLCIAHHADDQAETILMRFAKGSGIDGLAGMDPVTVVEGVRLVRPLLAMPKARLLATCEVHHVPFVIDPTNATNKYARGRLRKILPHLEPEGLTPERLCDLGERAREARDALTFYTRCFLQEAVHAMPGGAYRLDLTSLRGIPRATGLRALSMILDELSPQDYAPERKSLLPILEWLCDQDEGEGRTLQGSIIQKGDLCDKAIFLREPAAATESLPISAQQTVRWDTRWQVTYIGVEEGLEVRALGVQDHDLLDRLSPSLRRQIPQGRIRAGLPALWRGDSVIAIPSFDERNQSVMLVHWPRPSWE